jgi:hypothetical protein
MRIKSLKGEVCDGNINLKRKGKSCNKDITTLGIKESRLLVLKYFSLYTSKIIGML